MSGLPNLLRFLKNMGNKRVIADSLLDLSGIVLKINAFILMKKTPLKQIR